MMSINDEKYAMFGDYRLPKRAISALKAAGVIKPFQLDQFTMTDLREIPGVGAEARKVIKRVRKSREEEDELDELDLGDYSDDDDYSEEEDEPLSITMTLTENDPALGPHRLDRKHFEWLDNVLKLQMVIDGRPVQTIEQLFVMFWKAHYNNDPTRGGTRGVVQPGAGPAGGGQVISGSTVGPAENSYVPIISAVPGARTVSNG